jgi:uncharacterized membrane protein
LGQDAATHGAQAGRITGPIDEAQAVTLYGNVHPLARAEFDAGAVSAETPLQRMVLELEPSAAQETELDALLEAQHDAQSPLYHHWLTPVEYGARFGVSAQDLARINGWLAGHGFVVEEVAASGRLVVFSGTAGMVEDTFHAQIHRYVVGGVAHVGNAQDPQIPAALAGVVGGVVSLHDFRRTSEISSRAPLGLVAGAAMLPREELRGLMAASPNQSPQYSSGSTHYLFPADWATIYDLNPLYGAGTNGTGVSIAIVGRSNIHVSDVTAFRSASGLTANNPTVILVGGNPGLVAGDQDESTLDVEWSGAIAPSAQVKFVVGESTVTTDGVDLSAQYVVNHATAQIVSTSYGSCEQDMGASELAFYNGLWQQAASEGMSAFVSSGDSGASGCDGGSAAEGTGKGVNGLCSSPYTTCVGGTEFSDGSNAAKYWNATNTTSYGSALSYIPEEVWNESGSNGGTGLWASGGGASLVYTEPSWQKNVSGTSATNGMRAVPDVAMAAAGHDGYILYENGSYWVISGTSAASPTFAGVMALVVQAKGGAGQGNANAGLYPLVNATHNPFHTTPSGNNSVPGVTGFTASGNTYNQATGLGSVDGSLLVSAWVGGVATGPDFALTASSQAGSVQVGKTGSFTVIVAESGNAKNAVALSVKTPTGVTATVSPASIAPGATATVTILVGVTAANGAQTLTLTGTDPTGTQNLGYALTVTQTPTLALTAAASSVAVVQGASGTLSLTAATGGAFTGNITFSVSGLATGVTAAWSANPITSASNSSTNRETLTLTAVTGTKLGSTSIVVSAAGDGLVANQSVTLLLLQAPGIVLAVWPTAVQVQSLSMATVTVTATPVGGMSMKASSTAVRNVGYLASVLAFLNSEGASGSGAASATGTGISVASGLPKGFTAIFGAPVLTPTGSMVWTLTLTGSSISVAGSSTLNLTAQVQDAITWVVYPASLNLPMTVTLTPPALTIATVSTASAVMQGKTGANVFSVTGNGTFIGNVNLTVSGLPSGVTAAWSSNPVILVGGCGTSTLTLTASSAATVGSATITVTAAGDAIGVSKQLTVQVTPKPALTLGAASSALSVVQGKTATDLVTLAGNSTYSGAVTLSVSGLPTGVTAAWSGNPVSVTSESGSSTLTLTASSAAAVGSTTVTVTAIGDGLTVSKQITLQVSQPPGVQLTLGANTLSMVHASSGTTTVTVTPLGGLSAAIALKVSGLPSGVTATLSQSSFVAPGSGSATLTFMGSSAAKAGTTAVTVAASGTSNAASYSASQVISLVLK